MLASVVVGAVGVLWGACFAPATFRCSASAECGPTPSGGICEPDDRGHDVSPENRGICSFPDLECGSGQRYDTRAASVDGACVPCGGSLDYCCKQEPRCGPDLVCGHTGTCGCVSQMASGFAATCVLTPNGVVSCWGGHLGSSPLLVPTPQPALAGAERIAVGPSQICAQRQDGTTVCVGDHIPPMVATLPKGTRLAIGYQRSADGTPATLAPSVCSLTSDGAVFCVDGRPNPAEMVLDGVVDLSASDSQLCAVKKDGTAWCWGRLKEGFTFVFQNTPIAVQGVTDAVQVATASGYGCARRRDGTIACWPMSPQLVAMPDTRFANAVDLATGGGICTLDPDRTLRCTDTKAMLMTIALPPIDEIALGSLSCARAGSRIWCWGTAPLGDGTANDSSPPVQVLFSCPQG